MHASASSRNAACACGEPARSKLSRVPAMPIACITCSSDDEPSILKD